MNLNNKIKILVNILLLTIYISIIPTMAIAKPVTENEFLNSVIKNMERDMNISPESRGSKENRRKIKNK